MFFEDNDGGVECQKAVLHAKRWDVYMNEKNCLLWVGIVWDYQVLVERRLFCKS